MGWVKGKIGELFFAIGFQFYKMKRILWKDGSDGGTNNVFNITVYLKKIKMVNFILYVHMSSQFFKTVIGDNCITSKKICIKKLCYFIFQKN